MFIFDVLSPLIHELSGGNLPVGESFNKFKYIMHPILSNLCGMTIGDAKGWTFPTHWRCSSALHCRWFSRKELWDSRKAASVWRLKGLCRATSMSGENGEETISSQSHHNGYHSPKDETAKACNSIGRWGRDMRAAWAKGTVIHMQQMDQPEVPPIFTK